LLASCPTTRAWSGKVEYRHVDRGSINFSFATPTVNAPDLILSGGVAVTSRFTDDLVRVGTDYHL
jgi:hypothetical protein